MKVLTTKKKYRNYLLDFTRFPELLLRGASYMLPIIPFEILWTPFTKSISLEGALLRVIYMKWLRKRTLEIPLLQLVIKLYCYQDDYAYPPYYVMKLEVAGKVRYELDNRDGYTKEELLAFMEDFATAKNACMQSGNIAAEYKGIN